MPRFVYRARDIDNRFFSGAMDAASVDEVLDRLGGKKLIPIDVDEANFDGSKKNRTFFEKFNEALMRMQTKVPYKSVVFFTRQLATMIEGGVPLSRSLEQLARSEAPIFKRIILQVSDDISMGNTFSDSISKHPGAFNNMFVSVVRSGEVTGALDKVLDQLAAYMENVEMLKAKVKAAMRYPLFIAGFVTLLVIGILWKLVPVFAGMYAGFNAKLPWQTQVLVDISALIQHNILFVFLGIIAAIAGYKFGMTKGPFKLFVHTHILKFPVFGMILRKNILATFCRTMALLMESGTPILEAIHIAGAVVNNKYYANALEEVYAKVRQGELLSQSLENARGFPVLVTQLIATGEESGKVDILLRKAADFYEREIKNTVDSLAAIIEPFLIIILGGIVGSILIALYMPIFMLGKLMK
jgi:type IV pilus assembly protein PilC